ncbi:MAG: hypothetical protein ACRDGE_01540 [Candidatus Limnocylindria bacterium]
MPIVMALVVAAIVGGLALSDWREQQRAPGPAPSASPSVGPSASPSVSPSAAPSASPADGLVTYENPILGYRITLAEAYRRSRSIVVTGHEEALGHDAYTLLTELQEREECLSDRGHIGPPRGRESDVEVVVTRNVRGISAVDFASTPIQRIAFTSVEPATVDGREAARIAHQPSGEAVFYVIGANDRFYELRPAQMGLPPQQPSGWLDDIAASFSAIAPEPFPTPTPTPAQAPREAAAELGQRLAQAFAARDADAIRALITPRCWLNFGSTVPSGGNGRAVASFIEAIRENFASGDLTVSVDPEVQVEVNGVDGTERYFVRSDWREADRTTRVDLFLEDIDGQWYWVEARHHHEGGASYSCLWSGTLTPGC